MWSFSSKQSAENISLWAWICGARIINSTPDNIMRAYELHLISARDARQLLNINASDYDLPEETV